MKKITILLVLVLLCSAVIFPMAAGAQDSDETKEKTLETIVEAKEGIQIANAVSGDFEYTGFWDDTARVEGYLGTDTDIVIPSTIEGYTVVQIDNYSFNNLGLTSVVLPDSVEKIGSQAFAHNNLASVTYPTTLLEMGEGAFNDNAITLVNGQPSNGIIYGRNTFVSPVEADYTTIVSYGGVADVIDFIPSTVKTIGNFAFDSCSITSVTIPDNVTKIGYAFDGNNFNSFTLPDVEGVWTCEDGNEYAGGDTVSIDYWYELYMEYEYSDIGNGECSITAYNGEDTVITIPETLGGLNVVWITSSVFEDRGLTAVTLPSGLRVIGNYAFRDNGLTSLNLPDGVETIGESAFEGNIIAEITMTNSIESIGDAAFNNNIMAKLNGQEFDGIFYKRDSQGNEVTTTIVSYGGVSDSVIIPEGVTIAEENSFARCGLTSVTFPYTIQILHRDAFKNNGLDTVTLRASLTDIWDGVFEGNNFSMFRLPNTDLNWDGGDNVVYAGGAMVSVDYGYTKDLIYRYDSHGDGTCTIHTYNSGSSYPEIPDTIDTLTVISIAANTFEDKNIYEVTLPANLETIGEMAFYDNNIQSIDIPASVTEIGVAAFNKNAITTVNGEVSDGIIYAREPDGSVNTERIVSYGGAASDINFIPEGVTRIDNKAFMGAGADSVIIPYSVNMIGEDAFAGNNFTHITLPEGSGEWDGSEGTCYGGQIVAADGYYYVVVRPADADIDNNGVVDLLDIAAVAQHYQEYDMGFDQTGNGLVNLYDLVVVASEIVTY